MSQPASSDWLAENQRALMGEVDAVRALLLQRGSAPTDAAREPGNSALDSVCGCFGLSEFERRIVVLCAAPELDARFSGFLAEVAGDPARANPTFGLALGSFPDAHWSALGPSAPLRAWRLVEPGPGPITSAPLRLDEWLLHVLTGIGSLDQRLTPVVEPLDEPAFPPASAEAAVDALASAWVRPGSRVPVLLAGPSPEAKRAVFLEACARLGWWPCRLRGADLPATPAERHELLRLWEREALLHQAALLVELGDGYEQSGSAAVDAFVERLSTPAALSARDRPRTGTRPGATIDVDRPTAAEQRALWKASLDGADGFASLNGSLDRVIAQFDLDAAAIASAAARAAGAKGDGDAGSRLWDACRRSARGGLDELAQRLETTVTFDDLVLPEAQRELLEAMLAQVRHRSRVYDDWQMAGPSRRGLGISALFAGASGTGKTLAAEVLAATLELDLYRIDLSQVVSKYIGETEKNLRRVFGAASQSGAVLLFDEADALFGKRSEVRDSHDRYANVEISYLLQAMEAYRGLAVLTTNMRNAVDPAFLRRLRFVVTFPFPGPDERARIWARAFPTATPTRGLDVTKLAQLSIPGGNIRSIALHAAFYAADGGVPVGMPEVLRAAVAEYGKLERAISDAEIAGWA